MEGNLQHVPIYCLSSMEQKPRERGGWRQPPPAFSICSLEGSLPHSETGNDKFENHQGPQFKSDRPCECHRLQEEWERDPEGKRRV